MSRVLERCLVCDAAIRRTDDLFTCSACGLALRGGEEGLLEASTRAALRDYPDWSSDLAFQVEDSSFWFRHRNRAILSLIALHPFAGRLWDVGGGNGFQAGELRAAGYDVVLVEPSRAGCRNALKRGLEKVVNASFEALALPAGRLAAVSLFDVIEHLPRPATLLAEVRRVVRPGARLYVTVPARPSLWSDEDDVAEHKRRYTRRSLADELGASGFTVERVTHFFQPLVVPMLLLRVLPYRLGLSRRVRSRPEEHSPPEVVQRIVDRLLARELERLARGGRVTSGASLLCVARA